MKNKYRQMIGRANRISQTQHELNMQSEFASALRLEEAHAEFIPVRQRQVSRRDLEYAEYLIEAERFKEND